MSSFASKLCGRRQHREPLEEVFVPEQAGAQQLTIAQQKQNDLFEAIQKCDLDCIKKLKEELDSFKDMKDNHKRTPLHVLAGLEPQEKKVKCTDELIKNIFMVLKEAGCDVNCVDEYGNTAVKLAAEKGSIQVLKCLIEENADIELPDKFKEDTPLHWAAKSGMFEATKLLIEKRAPLNPQNKDYETPLHLAVQKAHFQIVYLLLLCGADKNLKNKNGLTPLCIAKRGESKEILDLLNKSPEELCKIQKTTNGRGEFVEADSGGSVLDSIPWTNIVPANVSVQYHVEIHGGVAAVGPGSRVNVNSQDTQAALAALSSLSSPTTSREAAGQSALPLLTPSPSTSGSSTTSSSAAVTPTAPLSPLPMDESPPLPTAPLVEEEESHSSSGR